MSDDKVPNFDTFVYDIVQEEGKKDKTLKLTNYQDVKQLKEEQEKMVK